MLRLGGSESYWLDLLPNVALLVRPCSTRLMLSAQSHPDVLAAAEDKEMTDGERGAVVATVLAKLAIEDWEGVGDLDGAELDVSDANVEDLMAHWPAMEAWQRIYMAGVYEVEQEKNVSAPSPNGARGGAQATAQDAPKPAKSARKSSTDRKR